MVISISTHIYQYQLLSGKKNIAIRRIVQHELDKPVKILLDHTPTTDHEKDSDFFMLSDMTDEFDDYFGEDKLIFDYDHWMDVFDKQEEEHKTNDEQKRGFKNGHADIGFGRDGVSQSAELSQKGNNDIIFATPHLIHKDKFDYKKLGNLSDMIQLAADKFIFDQGEELMPRLPEMRDKVFGNMLRDKTGLVYSRFESFTVVRQFVGNKDDIEQVSHQYHLLRKINNLDIAINNNLNHFTNITILPISTFDNIDNHNLDHR